MWVLTLKVICYPSLEYVRLTVWLSNGYENKGVCSHSVSQVGFYIKIQSIICFSGTFLKP